MSMSLKHIVSFALALLMTINTPAAIAADARSSAASSFRRHTVTLTADTLTGKLLTLESASSALEDQGDTLRNARGRCRHSNSEHI